MTAELRDLLSVMGGLWRVARPAWSLWGGGGGNPPPHMVYGHSSISLLAADLPTQRPTNRLQWVRLTKHLITVLQPTASHPTATVTCPTVPVLALAGEKGCSNARWSPRGDP